MSYTTSTTTTSVSTTTSTDDEKLTSSSSKCPWSSKLSRCSKCMNSLITSTYYTRRWTSIETNRSTTCCCCIRCYFSSFYILRQQYQIHLYLYQVRCFLRLPTTSVNCTTRDIWNTEMSSSATCIWSTRYITASIICSTTSIIPIMGDSLHLHHRTTHCLLLQDQEHQFHHIPLMLVQQLDFVFQYHHLQQRRLCLHDQQHQHHHRHHQKSTDQKHDILDHQHDLELLVQAEGDGVVTAVVEPPAYAFVASVDAPPPPPDPPGLPGFLELLPEKFPPPPPPPGCYNSCWC